MRLRTLRSVNTFCDWLQDKGFSPGENAFVGRVNAVHTASSLHYRRISNGKIVVAKLNQGRLAIDINDNDVDDDALPFDSEHEALSWLYNRILEVAKQYGWPLDEMFFDGKGFIHERGYGVNHPIGGHDSHLHIGFYKEVW